MEKEIIDFKYKERKPENTINIVLDFFKKRGFTVQIVKTMETEIGTHSCRIELFYKGINFGGSNGKGMTYELSLASGLAELYERFCNKVPNIYWKKNNYRKISQYAKEKQGYFLDLNEQITSLETLINQEYLKTAFTFKTNIKDEEKIAIFKSIISHQPYDIPYYSLDGEKKYFNPVILQGINGTTGMSAGNTFEEAFIQGVSEIFERYCSYDIMAYKEGIKYANLNLEQFKGTPLGDIIENTQKLGHDVYIIDLSYEYDLPVILAVVINKDTGAARICFGCFPVFEIAAERTMTELYQNLKSFNAKFGDLIQTPYRALNMDTFLVDIGMNFGSWAILPAYFFDKLEPKETWNKKCFLNRNASKQECFEYIKNKIEHNNLKIYYRNNGLDPQLYALHIFAENLPLYAPEAREFELLSDSNDVEKLISYAQNGEYLSHIVYQDNYIIPNDFIKSIQKYTEEEYVIKMLGSIITCGEQVVPVKWDKKITIDEIYNMFANTDATLTEIYGFYPYASTPYYKDLKKYHTLMRYKTASAHDNNPYTDEEIMNIFNYLGFTVTEEDLINYDNAYYLLQEIVFKNSWQLFHSSDYQEMLKNTI